MDDGEAKPWKNLVRRLSTHTTVDRFLRTIWTNGKSRPRFDDANTLAEFLLYREAMRRPVRANSAETLGLFRFELPGIDGGGGTPGSARTLGLNEAEWRDLLRLLVTHFLRTNVALDFDRWWLNWIDRRQSHIEVKPWAPGEKSSQYVRLWPNPYGLRLTRSRSPALSGCEARPRERQRQGRGWRGAGGCVAHAHTFHGPDRQWISSQAR